MCIYQCWNFENVHPFALCVLVLHHMSVVCSKVSWDARVLYRSIHGPTLHQQFSYINIIFYLLILMYYTQIVYTRLYIIITVSTQFMFYVNSAVKLNIWMYLLHLPLTVSKGPPWEDHTCLSHFVVWRCDSLYHI